MNKQLISTFLAFFITLFMTTTAMAHPGHDHTASDSMLMHALFYGSIIFTLAGCSWFTYQAIEKEKNR